MDQSWSKPSRELKPDRIEGNADQNLIARCISLRMYRQHSAYFLCLEIIWRHRIMSQRLQAQLFSRAYFRQSRKPCWAAREHVFSSHWHPLWCATSRQSKCPYSAAYMHKLCFFRSSERIVLPLHTFALFMSPLFMILNSVVQHIWMSNFGLLKRRSKMFRTSSLHVR